MEADIIGTVIEFKTDQTETAACNGGSLGLECLVAIYEGKTQVAREFAEHVLEGVSGKSRMEALAFLEAFIDGTAGQRVIKVE